MIKEIKANLLDFPEGVNVICHVANCRNNFGSGVAAQIKSCYPQAYEADTKYYDSCDPDNLFSEMMGHFSYARTDEDKLIVNLYAQFDFGRGKRQLDYESFYSGLEKMRDPLIKDKSKKWTVGFPYKIGSDRAGGDWNVVLAMIHSVFDNSEIDVIICKFEGK
jgi:O-acetyl-ADP-ribose deacetylase (regulator of RNase III)